MRNASVCLLSAALLATLACGGGGGSGPAPAASVLTYADPVSTGFRFLQDPALTTSTHLVLNLVGPDAGSIARGAAVVLQGSAQVAWTVGAAGAPALQPGAVFDLGSPPQFVLSRITGGELQAGVFQKGPGAAPASFGAATLFSVALDLAPGAVSGPAALAAAPGRCFIQDASGAVVPIAPALGTLSLH